jgi:hypothetical protein
MRRVLVFSTLLLACGIAVLAGSEQELSSDRHADERLGHWNDDTIWVTNRDKGTVAVFDALTGALKTDIPIEVGTGAHDVVVSKRAGKAYVTAEGIDAISVVSASSLKWLRNIPTGDMPHHASIDDRGRTVAVGLVATNQIALIDTATDGEVARHLSSTSTTARAHAPLISNGGHFVFVPHETGNLLTLLHRATGTILLDNFSPGLGPSEVLQSRTGRYLWVSLRNDNMVKRYDLLGIEPPLEVFIGADTAPESLLLTHDERTLIVSLRSPLAPPARLAFVDVRTGSVNLLVIGGDDALGIPAAGTFGDLAVMSPNGRYVYATFDSGSAGQGGVAVVDVHRQQKVATWAYPTPGRPHGIDYSTVRLRRD